MRRKAWRAREEERRIQTQTKRSKEQHTNTRFKLCYSFLNCDNSQILSRSRRLKLHEKHVKTLNRIKLREKERRKQQSRRVNNSKVCIFSYFWSLTERISFFSTKRKILHFIKMSKKKGWRSWKKEKEGKHFRESFLSRPRVYKIFTKTSLLLK